ncbi:addiction module toxin RelE [Candidatus Termititenax persephonae]|uniref:Addiction module toxin RelE n=1 Tax=Candidatus Termititenax persephonae TaxID=2218525 RepID=A0A388TIT6_9BACT|nr:addiction module toxin RelE [Candidatus Termititenax persephonae]
MIVVLEKHAAKYLERLNEPIKGRIIHSLQSLAKNQKGDVKALSGQAGYRLRVGGYRILFGIKNDTIVVTNIAPRGQAYK